MQQNIVSPIIKWRVNCSKKYATIRNYEFWYTVVYYNNTNDKDFAVTTEIYLWYLQIINIFWRFRKFFSNSTFLSLIFYKLILFLVITQFTRKKSRTKIPISNECPSLFSYSELIILHYWTGITYIQNIFNIDLINKYNTISRGRYANMWY